MPENEEPVHTRKFANVMWVAHSGYMVYYNYSAQRQLVKTDTVDIKKRAGEKLNLGETMGPSATPLVNLQETDIGHPLSDISTNIKYETRGSQFSL